MLKELLEQGDPNMEQMEIMAAALMTPDDDGRPRVYYLPHPDALAADRIVIPTPTPSGMSKLVTRTRGPASVMRRRLLNQFHGATKVLRQGLDPGEGEVDDGALAELAMGDYRIFEDDVNTIGKSVAWSILIDQSGSMSHGSRAWYAAEAAYALGETLSGCQMPFEVFGWDTDYDLYPEMSGEDRRTVQSRVEGRQKTLERFTRIGAQTYYQYKSFDEPWRLTRARCSAVRPGVNNDDSAAIRFVASRLLQRKETWKILAVLTDGMPNHEGSTAREHGFAQEQLRQTIRLVRKAGIHDVGFGIQSEHVVGLYSRSEVVKDLAEFAIKAIAVTRDIVRASRR